MKRIVFGLPKQCCGCGVCATVCPKQCITISTDDLGFSIPILADEDKCINCGKCLNSCPQQNIRSNDISFKKSIFGQSNNLEDLVNSTSGAIFSLIAKTILEKGGLVWGVSINSLGESNFICIDSILDLHFIQGSKYVEVSTHLPYSLIKDQITNNKLVLVSGLPCQILGLYKFLGSTEYPNLFLVDLFCYGIQSPFMWKKYLSQVNPHNKKIENVSMRYKVPSWEDYSLHITFDDNSIYNQTRWKDPWLLSYSKGFFNRASCSCCQSKKFPKISDFTLGDFWGVKWYNESISPMKRKSGLSIAFMFTDKALALFDEFKDQINYIELNKEQVSKLYPKLGLSNIENPKRYQFISDVTIKGFSETVFAYIDYGTWAKYKFRILSFNLKLKLYLKNRFFAIKTLFNHDTV